MNNSISYQIGYNTGRLIFPLLLVLGAFHFARRSRQPGYNRDAALSLAIVLGVIGGLSPLGWLRMQQPLVGFMGLAMLAAFIWAFALAVRGARAIRRSNERGRAYLIWTFVLTAGFGAILISGAIGAHKPRVAQRWGPNQTARNEEFNYTISPKPEWQSFEAKKISPYAAHVFRRRNPEVYYLIIPEITGEYSRSELTVASQESFKSLLGGSTDKPRPMNVAGIEGFVFSGTARSGVASLGAVQWCGVKNGFAYQLVVRGPNLSPEALQYEASEFFRAFSQLDPNRHSPAAADLPLFKSPGFAYQIDLTKTRWRQWEKLGKEFDAAEFGARIQDWAYFGIIPVYLFGEDISLQMLGEAVADQFGATMTGSGVHDLKEKGDQISFRFEKKLDASTLAVLARVIKARGCAFLMAAWYVPGLPEADERIAEAIDSFSLEPGEDLLAGLDGEVRARALLRLQINAGQGLIYNHLGVSYFRMEEWEQSLAWFRRAAQQRPGDLAVAKNLVSVFKRLNRPEEAIKYLSARAAAQGEEKILLPEQAWFLAASGKNQEALALYGKVFATGYADDDQFRSYAQLVADSGDVDGAIEKVGAYLSQRESGSLRLLQTELLQVAKRASEAVPILLKLRERYPADSEVVFALATAQINAELNAEAIKTLETLSQRGMNSGRLFLLKGRAELGLRHYREAREHFELGAKLDPRNKDLSAYLDYVNGLLGQANNYSIKTEIAPVKIPESLLAGGKIPSQAESVGAYYSTYCVGIHFQENKRQKTTMIYKAKVVNSAGVTLLSAFEMPFDPIRESIYVNELKVQDEKGDVIANGSSDRYYIIDSGDASYQKILNIPVPGLRPGATVFLTVTSESLATKNVCDFISHFPSRTIPVAEGVFYLTGDIDKIKTEIRGAHEKEVTENGLALRFPAPPPLRAEPMQAPFEEFVPNVAIGPKSSDWNALAKEYLTSIEAKLKADGRIAELAKARVKDCTNELQKISALSGEVQNKIRYIALEFGRRGCIPKAAGETWDHAYGDCKDSALLLKHLLDSAGVPARLALVSPRNRLIKDIPSLDQFTHMIVYVPSRKSFLDPTEKNLDLALYAPYGLLGREALVLDERVPEFIKIAPPESGSRNHLNIFREVSITASNELEADETLTLTGYSAAGFRSLLKSISPQDRRLEMERLMARRAGGVELKDLQVENLEDVQSPLIVKSKFRNFRGITQTGAHGVLKLPTFWEDFYLKAEAAPDRKSPFEAILATDVIVATTIKGCSNWLAEPLREQNIKGRFGSGEINSQKAGSDITVRCRGVLREGRYIADDYSSYVRFMDDVRDLFQSQIAIKKATPTQ